MIKAEFVTHQPLIHGSPTVENLWTEPIDVVLRDLDEKIPPIVLELKPGESKSSQYQYYVRWRVEIWRPDDRLAQILGDAKIQTDYYDLDLRGRVVFIKMDAYALGDNLAWMPYVEEFQKKHGCHILCSTFWNDLFIETYPTIMFVKPNTRIDNHYAQYYIGTHDDTPPGYSPTTYITEPLQKVASDILGLEYQPLTARIPLPDVTRNKKRVCLSQYASLDMKTWHGDWQAVVDLFVDSGYEVVVISKEPNRLKRVTDHSGDRPIQERILDLAQSEYFIGVSSGLSWLAHSCHCHVFLISDFTPVNHEFSSNVTRIHGPNVRTKIKYTPIKGEVSTKHVILTLTKHLLKT